MKIYAVVGCWPQWPTYELQHSESFEDAEFFLSEKQAEDRVNFLYAEAISEKNARIDAHNKRYAAERERLDYLKGLIPEDVRKEVIFKNVPSLQERIATIDELDSHYTIIPLEVKE